MTKENVIASREALKVDKAPLKLICDNMILIDEANEVVIWDDANEKVKVIRPNPNAVARNGVNIQIIEFEYDVIQYMTTAVNVTTLQTYVKGLVNAGLCSQEEAKGILRWANDFNVNPQPIIEPTTDNSPKVPEEGSGDSMVEE